MIATTLAIINRYHTCTSRLNDFLLVKYSFTISPPFPLNDANDASIAKANRMLLKIDPGYLILI